MRKSLCLLLTMLCLLGCRGKEGPQPYRSVYRPMIVGVSSYHVGPGESTLTLLESELRGAKPFASIPWPRVGVTALPEDAPPQVQEYDFPSILELLNRRRFTPTTGLRVGETINFPDLNYDGRINGKRGEYRGLLMFSGVLAPEHKHYIGNALQGGEYFIALRVK